MTLPAAYFDQLYGATRDPWGFESRWYEQRKYALTVASLPREEYRRGFEIGCSVGVLTEMLADRCRSLIAVDVAEAAVCVTRERLAGRPEVEIAQCVVPHEWPIGRFDLVVLSEVGYYFSAAELGAVIHRAAVSLDPDGALVAVHWLHDVADYPLAGQEVHDAIARLSGLDRLLRHEEADFLLEVFVPAPATSVARTTGLVS